MAMLPTTIRMRDQPLREAVADTIFIRATLPSLAGTPVIDIPVAAIEKVDVPGPAAAVS
jgi:hypothetical protein